MKESTKSWIAGGLLAALVSSPICVAVDLLIMVGAGVSGGENAGAFPLALGLVAFAGGLAAFALAVPVGFGLGLTQRLDLRNLNRLALTSAMALPILAVAAALFNGAFASITDTGLRTTLFVTAVVLAGGFSLSVGWFTAGAIEPWLRRRAGKLALSFTVFGVVLALAAFDLYLWILFTRRLPAGVWLTGAAFFALVAAAWVASRSIVPYIRRLSDSLTANRGFRVFLWASPLLFLFAAQTVVFVDPGAARYLASRGGLSGRLLLAIRDVADLDGDGASWVLGGGDCDDFDRQRHPLALEVPGNGIDEDCDGRDRLTGKTQEGKSAGA
ncbi:MAG: hypothetical protein GXP54_02790, partial [Deltaproteobacteria bacterium]|nr:hypothetical protein [Deltaproteobacteria bacterium]